MNRKIYAVVLALTLALSMNAFAGEGGKSCCKSADAKQCDMKDKTACCKEGAKCDDHSKCDKECEKSCEAKKADKKAA